MDLVISIIITVSIIVLILWILVTFFILPKRRESDWKRKQTTADPKAKTCPLCKELLKPGELVKTAVFPGKQEKLTHIFGCPYCYPPNQRDRRICPVCRKEVPREGYVIARMFVTPGRKHVHVLGCSGCRMG